MGRRHFLSAASGTDRSGWLRGALLTLALTGCAGPQLREDILRFEPTFASPPAVTGALAELATGVTAAHGADHSGFHLLDSSHDALAWRLALIDSAVSSIDVQTYLWFPDSSGLLLLQRLVQAAERGVRVRLIVDDLLTHGQDQFIFELNNRPNIEVGLFNPWGKRRRLQRAGQFIAQMERLNTRMHDKLLIADGRAAILGGRNIGDHYFGLSRAYNFHDLDVLGFGPVAEQANRMFDHFWNSGAVVSAANLDTEHDPDYVQERWNTILATNRSNADLAAFPAGPRDWSVELAAVRPELQPGTSFVVFDEATASSEGRDLATKMFGFMDLAQQELLITNAYIIPGERAVDWLRSLEERGVRVRILTNSLASHDVPAVNSHYKGWRDDFIEAGVELYEWRADAAIKASIVEVPPVSGEFTGLHTKSVVVDREMVFIGSMNFDPRSININTEGGVFIRSPGLAEQTARLMERDMHPDNAWQVLLDGDGDPYWENSVETLHRQPARGGTQRVMDVIFGIFPEEQY